MAGKVKYREDFERIYGYDGHIDYREELRTFNKYVKECNKDGIKSLLIRHGGSIALVAKAQYQKDKFQTLQ